MHKGSLVGIEGRIQTRNYENKQGQRVYVTEVVVENFTLLEPRSQNGGNGQGQSSNGNHAPSENPFGTPKTSGQSTPNNGKKNDNSNDPFANSGDQIDISDDDLPF